MLLSWPLSREGIGGKSSKLQDWRASDILGGVNKLKHGGISSNGRAPA